MARMPGAEWRPLPRPSSTRMDRYDLVVIHTMVGSLAGTDSYFRGITSGVNSHFGTGGGGELYQWVDTDVRSGANLEANGRSITVENADMGPGFAAWNTNDSSAVPPFTPQQIETNARVCAWAHTTHGVPLEPADTSLPGARGVGFHRLGINPWRLPAGELWSSATGKVCPSPRRIEQIPLIIARARQIVGGAATTEDELVMDAEARTELGEIKRLLGVLTGYSSNIANQNEASAADVPRVVVDNNRLLGVLLGWKLPATEQEAAALAALRTDGTAPAPDPQAFAELLRPMLMEAVQTGMAAREGADASALADELAKRLAA